MGDIFNVNEIDKSSESLCKKQKPLTKFRELLSKIIKTTPKITNITECEENGDMAFTINLKDLGLTADDFTKYNKEFFSNYIVDMLGELLIRENLQEFAGHLQRLKTKFYINAVSQSIHKRFGMKVKDGVMSFYFHISLIQDILTEDFKLQ
jgi:hypothetical protein